VTEQEGRGVQVWQRVASEAISRLRRSEAMDLVSELSDGDFKAMLIASSAAGVALEGEAGGNLLYESAVERMERVAARGPSRDEQEEQVIAVSVRRAELKRKLRKAVRP
jgi:hypothetical protein